MAQMTGADISDLESGAARLESVGSQIGGMRRPLRSQLYSSYWEGRAAERFRSQWDTVHGPALNNAEDFLHNAGQRLRTEADEQRQASNMGDGGRGSAFEPCSIYPEAPPGFLQDRYTGSRSQITTRIDEIEQELEDIDARLLAIPFGFLGVVNPVALGLMRQAAALRAELGNLKKLKNIEGRQILSVSGVGEDQRITEVYGDLENADRVIIHVPGMSTDLGDYGGSYRGEFGHEDALRLKEAAEATSGLKVAVVSFADYDVPQNVASAAMAHGAEDGAPKLRALVADLHSLGYGTDRISVVGHSYGSVVVGHAMQQGLDVREVVVAGSPGMGPDSRAGLGSPDVRVVAVAPGSADIVTDDVAGLGGPHGLSPNNGHFGADAVIQVDGNLWHSSYFKGNTGLRLAAEAVN